MNCGNLIQGNYSEEQTREVVLASWFKTFLPPTTKEFFWMMTFIFLKMATERVKLDFMITYQIV